MRKGNMLPKLEDLMIELEDRKSALLKDLKSYSAVHLRFQPGPDRWSMQMALQHIILGEKAIRLTEAELRDNPVRQMLKPGDMFTFVIDILEKDIPVEVPHPFVEPDGSMGVDELITLWDIERKALCDLLKKVTEDTVNDVIFSHPAAGPLDPVRTLQLAIAHFDTHRRQIDKLRSEIERK